MTGYVDVGDQVDRDFHHAHLKASLREMWNWMRRKSGPERLLAFGEAKDALTGWSQACLPGIRPVEVEKVVGSVGRWRDFDGEFLPRKSNLERRWSRVDRAYHQGVELPAVSLYKVGDEYFVVDGNPRVSVARYHKVVAIDAEVVELRGRKREAAAHGAAGEAGSPPRQSRQRPSEAIASWLPTLWQHLRLGPRRPKLRPLS
jgi:hypothetical protein